MKQEIRLAGIGGQGIIFLGNVLARAFSLYENLRTVQTTFYSAAYRGGLSTTDIIVTDEELYDLTVHSPTCLALTANKAFAANTSLFDIAHYIVIDKHNISIDDKFQYKDSSKFFLYDFPFLARENNLKPLSANMIMLGVISKKSGIVSQKSLISALSDVNKKDFDDNAKAISIGYSSI